MKFVSKWNDSIWSLTVLPTSPSIKAIVKITPVNKVGGLNVRHTIKISVENLIAKYSPLGEGARRFIANHDAVDDKPLVDGEK